MYNPVPSKASLNTTSFGISKREVVLLGSSIFIGLALLAIPYAPIFIRVVVSFIFMGVMALYTFWKIDGKWPIEVFVINKMKFRARHRAFVKGGQRIRSKEKGRFESSHAKTSKPLHPILTDIPDTYSPSDGYLVELPKYSNAQLLASVTGVVLLAILLAWAGTGGIQEAQNQLRYLFGR